MPRNNCPDCGRTLPYAGRRCARCGWVRTGEAAEAAPRRGGGLRRALMTLAVLVGLVAVGYRMSGPALGEWYAEFAASHLPAHFSRYAPVETPTGAFFACVQGVARQVSDRSAVETFPVASEENTTSMGEGRYRVQSYLEAVRDSGETVRRPFTCVVRYQAGRWKVEEVAVERALAAR